MVGIGKILFEKPLLHRCEENVTRQDALFGLDNWCQTSQRRKLRDRLVLEQLRRPQAQAGMIGSGNNLNTQDRVSSKLEKIVVNADALDTQQFAPNFR